MGDCECVTLRLALAAAEKEREKAKVDAAWSYIRADFSERKGRLLASLHEKEFLETLEKMKLVVDNAKNAPVDSGLKTRNME